MKYREFCTLTDAEIKFIMNDIFHPIKIGEISRMSSNEIDVDIYIMEEEPDFADSIWLTPDDMGTHDFTITNEENLKYQKFLLAKGMDIRLKDNPYLVNN